MKNRCVFIDRDGTLNEDTQYLYRPEEFVFTPGAPGAVRILNDIGVKTIVVTNQAGVARGYYTVDNVIRLHDYINELLEEAGAKIDAFYICPHHPTEGIGHLNTTCDCRKPGPGMLLKAAEDWNIDLRSSFMIGDKLEDLIAGSRAECTPILVLTGYGRHQDVTGLQCEVAHDLFDAVTRFVAPSIEMADRSQD